MNANQIHTFEDYAVCEYGKPNGNAFIPDAIRIKVVRIFDEAPSEYSSRQRATSYVQGLLCDKLTGDPVSTEYTRYRARDVISDWDEYWDAYEQYEVEQAKNQRERDERQQREREEYEKRRREQDEEIARRRSERDAREAEFRRISHDLKTRLDKIGIHGAMIDPFTRDVTIPFLNLQEWLDSLEKQACDTCEKEFLIVPSIVTKGV